MGRWGYRLFEGDQDLDIACELDSAFGQDKEICLSRMVHQTDMMAPLEIREFYKTKEYLDELDIIVGRVRAKLDSGLGDKLFKEFRAKEHEDRGQYRVILVGAMMMRAGAKIQPDDFQHLRDLVPKIPSLEGFMLCAFDDGFRNPGRVQFLTALDNYQPGTPRNFNEPSCFHCGKVRADLGSAPKKCGHCERAWYCGVDCQRAHRKAHKPFCKSIRETHRINV